jgi:hypothetical protein
MSVVVVRSTDGGAPALDGTAGSLVAVLSYALPLLGWTVAFTGTNKAAYLQGAGSCGFYFRVLDDGSATTDGAKSGMLVGYESMTDVDTGTNPFPTAAQMAEGTYIRKSKTADATARAWMVVGDSRSAYIWVDTADYVGGHCTYFGDFRRFVASDVYCCGIIGNSNGGNCAFKDCNAGITGTTAGAFIARNYIGTVGAVALGKYVHLTASSGIGYGGAYGTQPAYDGLIHYADIEVHENAGPTPRGWLRGVFGPQHNATSMPANHATKVAGDGTTLEALQIINGNWVLVQIDGSWAP